MRSLFTIGSFLFLASCASSGLTTDQLQILQLKDDVKMLKAQANPVEARWDACWDFCSEKSRPAYLDRDVCQDTCMGKPVCVDQAPLEEGRM